MLDEKNLKQLMLGIKFIIKFSSKIFHLISNISNSEYYILCLVLKTETDESYYLFSFWEKHY